MKAAERQASRPGQEGLPPGQHLVLGFPVLDLGKQPEISREDWRLELFGLVRSPQALGWKGLMALPQAQIQEDIHCVTHWSRLAVRARGVPAREVASLAQPLPQAGFVLVHSSDGYSTNLAMEDFLAPSTLLCHEMDGLPLSREHGGPARLLVPHLYLWKSAKWVCGIQFLEKEDLGFWEKRGYHRRGDPWRGERYSR